MTDEEFVLQNKPKLDDIVHPNNPFPWREWLSAECEVRGQTDDVIWYGSVNCNYFVYRGHVIHGIYGYHGKNVFNALKDEQVRADWFQKSAALRRELISLGVTV